MAQIEGAVAGGQVGSEPLNWHDSTKWELLAGKTLPAGAARRTMGWYVVSGTAYLCGGVDATNTPQTTVYKSTNYYDWSVDGTGALPFGIAWHSVTRIGDFLYIFGGNVAGAKTNKILRAPVASPADWSDTGAVLPSVCGNNSPAIVGTNVYIFGGEDNATDLATIYSAPLATPLVWSDTLKTLPLATRNVRVVVAGGWIVMYGGARGGAAANTIYVAPVHSPSDWFDTGRTLPDTNYAARPHVIGENIYLVGGQSNAGISQKYTWVAPVDRPWEVSVVSPLAHPDGDYVSAHFLAPDGYVYAIGGQDTVGVHGKIYRTKYRGSILADTTASTTAGRFARFADGQPTVYSAHQRSVVPNWLLG